MTSHPPGSASVPFAGRALLALLLLTLAFAAVFFGAVEPWAAGAATALVTLTAAAALVPSLLGQRTLPRDPLLLAGALLVFGSLVTLPVSVNRWLTLQWTQHLIAFAAVYLVAVHATKSRRAARILAGVLLAVALATAIYGLFVTLTGREVVLYATKTAYRDSLTGTFINRNHYAGFLALALYPVLGAFAGGSRKLKALLLLPIAALLLALGLTLSRGGLLAFFATLPLFLALLPRMHRRGLALATLALGLAALGLVATNADRLGARIEGSFNPDGEPSALARLSLWRSTLRAAAERPFLGFGAGTFESFYPRFREIGIARKVSYAHQDYLEVAAEQGLVGFALALAALVLVARGLRRALLTSGNDRHLVAGLVAGVVAIALQALVDFPLKIPAIPLWAATFAGLAVRLGDRTRPLGRTPSRVLAVLGLASCIWAAQLGVRTALADRYLLRADRLFWRSSGPEWDKAAVEYQKALRLDRMNPKPWDGLARTENNRSKFRDTRHQHAEAALAYFAEAEARDPAVGEYNLSRAWLLSFLGRPQEAAAEFDLAVADDPANANVLFHAASFRLHRKETEPGLMLLGRAVRAWPNFFGGKVREIDRAVGDSARVLAILPDNAPFLAFQYAMHLLESDRREEALRAFDQAARLGGYRDSWVIPYGGLLARKTAPADAVAFYRAIPVADRTPGMEFEIMKLLLLDNRRLDAIASLAAATRLHARDAEILRLLVAVAGDAPESRDAVERYRKEVGEDAGYAVAMGGILVNRQRFQEALSSYERARALDPGNPHARSGAAFVYERLAEHAETAYACDAARALREAALETR